MTPEEAAAVNRAVRAFMQTVSHSVTQDGPLAWIKYFDASPKFFMAVNGQMAFPNADAAQDGTRKFAQTIRQIELKWGMTYEWTRSPMSSRLWRSHGAKFKPTPRVVALPKRDTLPDSLSIMMDTGSSVMLTGPHPFRLTERSLTKAHLAGRVVSFNFPSVPFLLQKASARDGSSDDELLVPSRA